MIKRRRNGWSRAAPLWNDSPENAAYHDVAFSPDGRTVWASPSSALDDDGDPDDNFDLWFTSDALDLDTGAVEIGHQWDTGVVEHPGGGLVATLMSNQGATHVLFARPGDTVPASMRFLRDAIILDADGYETPVFSDDGRYLAVRGNAYEQSLDIFEFPTLRRVLYTTLNEPNPGHPAPPEWLEEHVRWSRHNIAFAPGSAALLVGTPEGAIVELDLDGGTVSRHDVGAEPISAVAVASTGQLVVADRSGRVAVRDVPGVPDQAGSDVRLSRAAGARALVEKFFATTTAVPGGANLEMNLVRHDGERIWSSGELESVATAEESDPTWLRLQAAFNNIRQEHGEPQP